MKGPFTDIYTDEHIFAPESQLSAAMLNALALRQSDEFWMRAREKLWISKPTTGLRKKGVLHLQRGGVIVECAYHGDTEDPPKEDVNIDCLAIIRYYDPQQRKVKYYATTEAIELYQKIVPDLSMTATFLSKQISSKLHRFELVSTKAEADGGGQEELYLLWSDDNAVQEYGKQELLLLGNTNPEKLLAVEGATAPGIVQKVIKCSDINDQTDFDTHRYRKWNAIFSLTTNDVVDKESGIKFSHENGLFSLRGQSFEVDFEIDKKKFVGSHYWVFPDSAELTQRTSRSDCVWHSKMQVRGSWHFVPDPGDIRHIASPSSAEEVPGIAKKAAEAVAEPQSVSLTPPTSAPKPVQQWFASIDLDEILGLGPEDVMEMIKDAFGNPKIRTKGWMEAITEVLNQRDAEDINIS